MGKTKQTILISLSLLIIAFFLVQPVSADIAKTTPAVTEKMSIAYRGNGGYLVGNTIIFDGTNTAGNTTLLKLTGPGLPASGVPLMDMTGSAGSGNTIDNNPDGTWRYVWYTSNIKGIDKIQTARYTITASDLANPDYAAATSIFLKKPDFSVVADPAVVKSGEYVQIYGNAENGVSSVRIDVADLSGNVIKNYEAAVSASGYFNTGFHMDLPAGQYYVIITNPLTKRTSFTTLTVSSGQVTATPTPASTAVPVVTITVPATPGQLPPSPSLTQTVAPPVTSAPPVTAAPALPLYILAIIGGLIVVCIVLVFFLMQKKNP